MLGHRYAVQVKIRYRDHGHRKPDYAFLATDAIIALETRLNAIVYDAFDLTPDERHLIERATKYPYGEV